MQGPIALKLRALREERGLTQKEAAELANVSHWTLLYLESGKRPPYMPTVTQIARAYGVPVEELVEEEEPSVQLPRSLRFPAFPARPSARTSHFPILRSSCIGRSQKLVLGCAGEYDGFITWATRVEGP